MEREDGYPAEFVSELTSSGYLGVLIPEQFGGAGLGVLEASAVMEEICRSGAHAGVCHAQMYVMGSVLRHGSDEQKSRYLPKIASGELRLQSWCDRTYNRHRHHKPENNGKKVGDQYIINGQKVWISRIQHSDLMLLLARTTDKSEVAKKTDGLSTFIIDVKAAEGNGLTIRPIESMINHHSCELFFDDLAIPAENLLGQEGKGFK